MKKKVILAATIAAVATIGGMMGYQSSQGNEPIGLTLANIEALSDAEVDNCNWSRKSDKFGCIYHECEPGGVGYLCHCGDIV